MLADSESTVVINGDKHLAGRLCSVIAKMLLNGNRVILVNAEKILMSGSRANILKENEFRENGGKFLVPIPTPNIIGI